MSDWIGSAVYQLGGGFVIVDAAMAQALGYAVDEMVGRPAGDFMAEPEGTQGLRMVELVTAGHSIRVTTGYRHGISGRRLWITFDAVPLSPVQPDLVLITLLTAGPSGAETIDILTDLTRPAQHLRLIPANLGTALLQQVTELREAHRRESVLRRVIQYSARTMLAEEYTADSPQEELAELRDRLTRLLMLLATAGAAIDDASGGAAWTA